MAKNYYVSGEWNFICSVCLLEKPKNNFYIHSNGKPRKQCKACLKLRAKKYSKEERNAFIKSWVNRNKEKALDYTRTWRKNNLEYDAFRSATRRATKKQQCPRWAQKEEIKKFYLACPKGFHVDHIIPLKGQYVSGLHVLENLQYLPAKENLQKGNRYVI